MILHQSADFYNARNTPTWHFMPSLKKIAAVTVFQQKNKLTFTLKTIVRKTENGTWFGLEFLIKFSILIYFENRSYILLFCLLISIQIIRKIYLKSAQLELVTSQHLGAKLFLFQKRAWLINSRRNTHCYWNCFRNSSIDNQIGGSDNNGRKDVLSETFKETINGNQTVPHKNSFTGNESIVKMEINDDRYAGTYFIDL